MPEMPRAAAATLALALLLPAAACSGGDGDGCDDFGARLSRAADGDVVTLGTCRVIGPFAVPPGVTVRGEGIGQSVVVAPPDAVALTLGADARVESLTVESAGVGGISGGGGAIRIEDVEVHAETGYGIRIEGGDGHGLSRVTLVGPVNEANADEVPVGPEPSETATHGLVVIDTADAIGTILNDVTISGFARFGALFLDSTIVWNDGRLEENLRTGLMARGGQLALAGVEIRRTLQGVQPIPSYGAVFSGGARVGTDPLILRDNEGLGVLHDDSEGTHVGLVATDNGDPGVWAQRSPSLEISGESSLVGNALAGVVVVDTPATIRGASIDTSRLATRIDGEVGEVRVGDGIHAVLPETMGLLIQDVALTGNERAGILIDVESDTVPSGVVVDVTVDGTGSQLGAVAQGPSGIIASGAWDSTVTRLGDTALNDAALTAVLDVMGLVGPMYLPPAE